MTEREFSKIERLLSERHANLVDAVTRVVCGLQEDIQSLREHLDDMQAERKAMHDATWDEITAINTRLAAIESRLQRGDLRFDQIEQQFKRS